MPCGTMLLAWIDTLDLSSRRILECNPGGKAVGLAQSICAGRLDPKSYVETHPMTPSASPGGRLA